MPPVSRSEGAHAFYCSILIPPLWKWGILQQVTPLRREAKVAVIVEEHVTKRDRLANGITSITDVDPKLPSFSNDDVLVKHERVLCR